VGAQLAKEKDLVFAIECDPISERVIGRVPNLNRILGNLVNISLSLSLSLSLS
jgi:hypothetical protein